MDKEDEVVHAEAPASGDLKPAPCWQRITPVEAEERAGMGASKNWKKSLLVVTGSGEQITLRKLLTQIESEGGADCVSSYGAVGTVQLAAPMQPTPSPVPQMLINQSPGSLPVQPVLDTKFLSALALLGLWPMSGLARAPASTPCIGPRALGAPMASAAAVHPARDLASLPALSTKRVAAKHASRGDASIPATGNGSPILSSYETVRLVARSGSFTGLFYLQEYLQSRKFSSGRAPGPCVAETSGPGGDPLPGPRITPGEAEERAGLGSNKNWKKSFM